MLRLVDVSGHYGELTEGLLSVCVAIVFRLVSVANITEHAYGCRKGSNQVELSQYAQEVSDWLESKLVPDTACMLPSHACPMAYLPPSLKGFVIVHIQCFLIKSVQL